MAPNSASSRGPSAAADTGVGPTARKPELVEKTMVVGVRPDPEPGDLVVLQNADGTTSEGHAGGVDGVAIVNLLEVKAGVPGFFRNSRYAFWARVRISGGRSRYAAQKRGVGRDLTVCRGRVPSLCRLRAQPGPRPRAWLARPARPPRTGVPTALRPEVPRTATGRFRSCSSAGSVVSFAMAVSSARGHSTYYVNRSYALARRAGRSETGVIHPCVRRPSRVCRSPPI